MRLLPLLEYIDKCVPYQKQIKIFDKKICTGCLTCERGCPTLSMWSFSKKEEEVGIKVHINPLLRQYTNDRDIVEVNGNTVSECLKDLEEQLPELKLFDKDGKLFAQLCIFEVRGGLLSPKKLDKPVRDGDELSIVIMIGGG